MTRDQAEELVNDITSLVKNLIDVDKNTVGDAIEKETVVETLLKLFPDESK